MRMPARGHRFVPIAILAVGWAVGVAVYLTADSDDSLPFELTADSKLYLDRLEKLGGKSAVFYAQLNDFVASLWHGPRLGVTIGVLSSLVALCWFLLTSRRDSPGPM
ncbi:MAG TPA: hypothetical protein VFA79_11510 [Myxococcales bacterium]|nr:hypothetical protein [Myxococcales bacterium]